MIICYIAHETGEGEDMFKDQYCDDNKQVVTTITKINCWQVIYDHECKLLF